MNPVTRVLNRSGDIFFAGPGFDRLWASRLKGKTVCFCYHRVDDPNNHSFLTNSGYPAIRPEELRADILSLKELGFDFLTFEDWRKNGAPDPGRPHAIITFDDCFRDNYENGVPVLDEQGVKAVFFQVTSMVDSPDLLWEQAIFWHCQANASHFDKVVHATLPEDSKALKLCGLDLGFYLVEHIPFDEAKKVIRALEKAFPAEETRGVASEIYPSSAHLAKARSTGHELASHGHLHYKRVNVSAKEFEEDLVVSVERLRSWMGKTQLSYAYPHGNYMTGDKEICAKYFQHVATIRRGAIEAGSDPLDLPRFYWGGHPKNLVRRKRWLLTGTY